MDLSSHLLINLSEAVSQGCAYCWVFMYYNIDRRGNILYFLNVQMGQRKKETENWSLWWVIFYVDMMHSSYFVKICFVNDPSTCINLSL